jgi:5-methylcytosine-specific restriction endonuclease McrA
MKDFAASFYKSKAWQACRAAYLSKVGGLCEDCLAKGIYTPAEIVHHTVELTPENINRPEISLNPELLRAVCRECHAAAHGARIRRYKLDELGRVTAKE